MAQDCGALWTAAPDPQRLGRAGEGGWGIQRPAVRERGSEGRGFAPPSPPAPIGGCPRHYFASSHASRRNRPFSACLQILLPLARHLEERLTVSQSVCQSGKQSVRQLVGQAGRQTGKQKHTVFFQSRTSTNSGEPQWHRSNRRSNGRTRACRLKCRRFNSWPAITGAGPSTHCSFSPDPGSNPSKHKLLTPSLPKMCHSVQGDRGLKIKKSIGGLFCRAK